MSLRRNGPTWVSLAYFSQVWQDKGNVLVNLIIDLIQKFFHINYTERSVIHIVNLN